MKKKCKQLADRYQLTLMVLFGSFATGKNRPESDVDIAILPQKELSFEKEKALRLELSLLFKREVDLSFLRRASPLLLGQIAKQAKLLAGEKKAFEEFRINSMKQYLDFAPYFKLRIRTIKNFLSHA